MFTKLDINKPAKEIIIDKFNARSGIQVNYEDVELGVIENITAPDATENAIITIVPTTLAPHINTFKLKYSRIEMSDVFSTPYLYVASSGYNTLYELLPEVNAAVGLNITVDDVDDASVFRDLGDPSVPVTVQIVSKALSVLYKGSATLVLDFVAMPERPASSSTSIVYALNKVPASFDYVSAHSFDGYKNLSFSFLKNVDLVVTSKIDGIYSCESGTIVLTGQFEVVATNLAFVNAALTYKVITLNREGALVSARTADCLLALVDDKDISVDTENKFFYVVDRADAVGTNPKKVYRLYQNGTVDATFTTTALEDGIVKLVPYQTGFFTVREDGTNYVVNDYALSGAMNGAFTPVTIDASAAPVTRIEGFAKKTAFSHHDLTLYMPTASNSTGERLVHQASIVQTFVSPVLTDFYSPLFTIENNGTGVKASGRLASKTNKAILNSSDLNHTLVRTNDQEACLFTNDSFGTLKFKTLTALFFGQDKEPQLKFLGNSEAMQVLTLSKVLSVSSGYEVYCVVTYIDPETGTEGSGIFSFGPDGVLNGPVVTKFEAGVTITDATVMRL